MSSCIARLEAAFAINVLIVSARDSRRLCRCIVPLVLQLLFADRYKNMTYIFRHAEAAGIMIMLANEQYAGHAEHAWNTIQKMTLGVMFITQHVRLPSPTNFPVSV